MAEKVQKPSRSERASRKLRNLHAIGALALEGLAVLVPPFAAPLTAFAGLEGLHAGAWEVARRSSKNRRQHG